MVASNNKADSNVKRILLLGDNLVTTSIITALSGDSYILHQAVLYNAHYERLLDVTIHQTNLSSASLSEIFRAASPDIVLSCLSASSFELQKTIIDTVVDANIPRFIAAEFGHDSLNPNIQARLPPYEERARTIRHLTEISANHRIEWLALSTGLCLDHGLVSGDLGFDMKWTSATMHGSGDERFAACSQAWYGRVVHSALQRWSLLQNQYLYVPGLFTCANDIVRALEQASGRHWDVGRGDVDECLHEAERRVARGFPDASMFLMKRTVMYDESLQAVEPYEEKDARPVLALESEQLEDVVQVALHQHKHHGEAGCGCD